VTLTAETDATYDAVTDGDGEDALSDVLAEINTLLTALDDAADVSATAGAESGIATFVNGFYDAAAAEGQEGVLAELDTGNTALDDAFNAVVADFEQRAELTGESTAADTAFDTTLTGDILADAEALQTARDDLKEAVTEADGELTEAQDLVSSLETLQGDYDTAVEDLETAQQYFEDEGLELPVAVEGGVTATAENDSFLYTEEAGTVSGFGLEGDDQLFVGSDFTWAALEAADDLATDRLGDSSVLEIFAQQNGNNVVLSFENEAFAGNATNVEDITEVTLTGVSVEDLSLSADGFITVA
jgi:tetratricopeptide (TPR) repeat protein